MKYYNILFKKQREHNERILLHHRCKLHVRPIHGESYVDSGPKLETMVLYHPLSFIIRHKKTKDIWKCLSILCYWYKFNIRINYWRIIIYKFNDQSTHNLFKDIWINTEINTYKLKLVRLYVAVWTQSYGKGSETKNIYLV